MSHSWPWMTDHCDVITPPIDPMSKCHVRVIRVSSQNCIQANTDIADVLRHIIKNVLERLFRNIQSPAPVTDFILFLFLIDKAKSK